MENISANAKNIDKQILFFLDNEQMKWSDEQIQELLVEDIG